MPGSISDLDGRRTGRRRCRRRPVRAAEVPRRRRKCLPAVQSVSTAGPRTTGPSRPPASRRRRPCPPASRRGRTRCRSALLVRGDPVRERKPQVGPQRGSFSARTARKDQFTTLQRGALGHQRPGVGGRAVGAGLSNAAFLEVSRTARTSFWPVGERRKVAPTTGRQGRPMSGPASASRSSTSHPGRPSSPWAICLTSPALQGRRSRRRRRGPSTTVDASRSGGGESAGVGRISHCSGPPLCPPARRARRARTARRWRRARFAGGIPWTGSPRSASPGSLRDDAASDSGIAWLKPGQDLLGVVGDQHGGGASGVGSRAAGRSTVPPRPPGQASRRFVEQQQLRIGHQRPCDLDAFSLPLRQGAVSAFAPGVRHQVTPTCSAPGCGPPARSPHTDPAPRTPPTRRVLDDLSRWNPLDLTTAGQASRVVSSAQRSTRPNCSPSTWPTPDVGCWRAEAMEAATSCPRHWGPGSPSARRARPASRSDRPASCPPRTGRRLGVDEERSGSEGGSGVLLSCRIADAGNTRTRRTFEIGMSCRALHRWNRRAAVHPRPSPGRPRGDRRSLAHSTRGSQYADTTGYHHLVRAPQHVGHRSGGAGVLVAHMAAHTEAHSPRRRRGDASQP